MSVDRKEEYKLEIDEHTKEMHRSLWEEYRQIIESDWYGEKYKTDWMYRNLICRQCMKESFMMFGLSNCCMCGESDFCPDNGNYQGPRPHFSKEVRVVLKKISDAGAYYYGKIRGAFIEGENEI